MRILITLTLVFICFLSNIVVAQTPESVLQIDYTKDGQKGRAYVEKGKKILVVDPSLPFDYVFTLPNSTGYIRKKGDTDWYQLPMAFINKKLKVLPAYEKKKQGIMPKMPLSAKIQMKKMMERFKKEDLSPPQKIFMGMPTQTLMVEDLKGKKCGEVTVSNGLSNLYGIGMADIMLLFKSIEVALKGGYISSCDYKGLALFSGSGRKNRLADSINLALPVKIDFASADEGTFEINKISNYEGTIPEFTPDKIQPWSLVTRLYFLSSIFTNITSVEEDDNFSINKFLKSTDAVIKPKSKP